MATKRYSSQVKAQILRSIAAFNNANKRGGVAHAVKKYGVTFLTLSRWLKKSHVKPVVAKKIIVKEAVVKKSNPKTVSTKKKSAPRKRSSVPASTGFLGKALTQSLATIGKLEREIYQKQALINLQKAKIKKLLA
jgi:hypothetical protein